MLHVVFPFFFFDGSRVLSFFLSVLLLFKIPSGCRRRRPFSTLTKNEPCFFPLLHNLNNARHNFEKKKRNNATAASRLRSQFSHPTYIQRKEEGKKKKQSLQGSACQTRKMRSANVPLEPLLRPHKPIYVVRLVVLLFLTSQSTSFHTPKNTHFVCRFNVKEKGNTQTQKRSGAQPTNPL